MTNIKSIQNQIALCQSILSNISAQMTQAMLAGNEEAYLAACEEYNSVMKSLSEHVAQLEACN